MREFIEFELYDTDIFQYQLNSWGTEYENFVLLNSNSQKTSLHLYHKFDLIAAVDSIFIFDNSGNNSFENFRNFNQNNQDWIFGYLSYDLKNEVEKLNSNHFDGIGFQKMYFFIPKYVIILKKNILRIEYLTEITDIEEIKAIIHKILSIQVPQIESSIQTNSIQNKFTKEEYLQTVDKIREHIHKGDIYELNLCQEFYIENIKIKPDNIYQKLNNISPAPFSCYMRNFDKYLICSSPERFLVKQNQKIISQPIKGTIRRSEDDKEDKKLRAFLCSDEKERAENMMIVDLVRNDLSRTAKKGSVKVEELCKIYSYGHVHQMISTISSELEEIKFDIIELLKTTFPMGSMTGAPKIKAMELIEKYEKTKRGLYSGSVGYISPNKDFDFNVIIRSILYNQTNEYLSFTVGSAITYQSNAENEYKECLLKAEALIKSLTIT